MAGDNLCSSLYAPVFFNFTTMNKYYVVNQKKVTVFFFKVNVK